MEKSGFSRQAGPIAVMLHEHTEGRKYVKFLLEVSEENRELTEDERRATANAIRAYTELLRSHIYKEDNILYPMADEALNEKTQKSILEKFKKLEKNKEKLMKDVESATLELKQVFKKINELIQAIDRTPFEGIGKPEPLKHQLTNCWSRRINLEHRLVYQVINDEIIIVSCKFHY